jgi:hypothetical protein
MIVQKNSAWVLAFHQYATAVLNNRRIKTNDTSIVDAIILMGDSLERVCHNVSQWSLTESLRHAFDILYEFNHGSLACQDEFNAIKEGDSFYYFNTPDKIVIHDAVTNMTMLRSVYDGLFKTQLGLYIGIALLGCFLGFVLLKLVMVRSDKRRYFWAKKQKEEFEMKPMDTTKEFEISESEIEPI